MQWAKIPLLFVVIGSVLGSAGCGGPTPTPTPTPSPTQTPTPSPTPTAPPVARLEITNSPNPAPWSGAPITTGACVGFANTWFYTTVSTETAGTAVNVTTTTNIIDGNQQIDLTGSLAINARGSATVPRQFCFGPAHAAYDPNDVSRNRCERTGGRCDLSGGDVTGTDSARRDRRVRCTQLGVRYPGDDESRENGLGEQSLRRDARQLTRPASSSVSWREWWQAPRPLGVVPAETCLPARLCRSSSVGRRAERVSTSASRTTRIRMTVPRSKGRSPSRRTGRRTRSLSLTSAGLI